MSLDHAALQGDDPDRDTWVTPRLLAKALGTWDLDPCSNARSHIQAKRAFDLDARGQDGIVLARYVARSSRVFINPPYSRGNVPLWVRAYQHTPFCFLLRFDPSTDWFEHLMLRTELVCVLRERVDFEPPPGVLGSSNPYPHALFYRNPEDATAKILAASYPLRPDRARGTTVTLLNTAAPTPAIGEP